MGVHDIKADKVKLNEILSNDVVRILVRNILSYDGPKTLQNYDLVYRQWVDDLIIGLDFFFGDFDTFAELEASPAPTTDGAYAFVGTGNNFSVYFWDSVAMEWKNTGGGGGVVVGTYAELEAIRVASELSQDKIYILSDFETIHKLHNYNDIHTGPIEPLLLKAIDNSTFSIYVSSLVYPKHKLEFDFTDNECEDGITPRKGLILRRYDPELNTDVGFDYLNVRHRRYPVLGKLYSPGIKVDDSTVQVTINNNVPGTLTNQFKYEVSFETLTMPAGQVTLNIQYNNGIVTKPFLYYLDQTETGTIPANYLSERKGTIIYNNVLDAFVFMSFVDLGADLIGKTVIRGTNNYGIGKDIILIPDISGAVDLPLFNGVYRDVYIPKNIDGIGTTAYFQDTVFLGYCIRFRSNGPVTESTFTKNINDVTIGNYLKLLVSDVAHNVLRISEWAIGVYFAYRPGNFGNYYHSFERLDAVTITPTHNFSATAISNMTIAFNAGNNFRSLAVLSEGNIFASDTNVGGSTPGNFYITAPQYRCLIGYISSKHLNINSTLNFATIYKRSFPNGENQFNDVSLNQLLIKTLPAAVGNVSLLGIDEEGNVVYGGEGSDTGFVTLAGPTQEIDGIKRFGYDAFRIKPEPGQVANADLRFVNQQGFGAYEIQGERVIGVTASGYFFLCRDLDDGYRLIANLSAFRNFTFQDKDGTFAFLSDIAPDKIVEYLESITIEENKLSKEAIQGTPYLEPLAIDSVTGALKIEADTEPTEDSLNYIPSGAWWTYEQNNPRGEKLWSIDNLRQARHSIDTNGHKVVVTPTSVIIGGDGTSGTGFNAMVTFDLINYKNINTGYFSCTGLEYSNGTTILCGSNSGAGTYVCKRSTNDGRTWTDITLPANSLPVDIATDHEGNWVICCETSTVGYPNVLYSDDDGLTWAVGTVVDEDLEFKEVVCAGGNFMLIAWLGTDRFQLSTDKGQTFSTITATNNSGHFAHSAVVHRGDIFITSNSGGSHNRLLRSQDNGLTLVGISNGFDDVPIRESGVAGPYVYVSAQSGGRLFRSLTGNPGDWEEVTTGITNEIKYIGGGIFNSEFYIVLGTTNASEKILINI